MSALILFISSFTVVFLLGFQSQIIRDRHALFAFFISLGIGTCQVASMRIVPHATFVENVFFVLGGSCGISASIYAHGAWKEWYYNRKNQKAIDAFQPMIDAERRHKDHPAYIATIDE